MRKLLLSFLLTAATTALAQTFHTVDGIRYLQKESGVIVARQDKNLGDDVTIPATITVDETTYNVTGIITPDDSEAGGGGAFQECAITGIDLSALSITEIPAQCFQGCEQLSSVTLPTTVTTIGADAFSHCTSLTAITLPDGVTSLGHHAFWTTGLTAAVIPTGITKIEEGTFADSPIKNVEIPSTITEIGPYAFANYDNLESVKMAVRDCRTIECAINAFGDMTTIDLQVPAGGKVVYQEYYPWSDMKSITEYGTDTGEALIPDQRHVDIDGIRYLLKDGEASVDIQPTTLSGNIVIPESVTYDGTSYPVTAVVPTYWYYGSHMSDNYYEYRGAFTRTAVTEVTLPNSITTLGAFAFYKANSLKKVTLSSGMTDTGWCTLRSCKILEEVVLPAGVTTLTDGCFASDPNLKSFVVPEGVTTIGGECFIGSGIETLTIPSTCIQLGYQSLELPQLKTLYVNVKEPLDLKATDYNGDPATMNGTVFGHDSEQDAVRERLANVDLIVPLGTAESYKVMAPWASFRSVTDQGSPYLKLNGSVFAAPTGSFTVDFPEGMAEEDKYEVHGNNDEYRLGLNLKQGVEVKFTTTVATSWVYVYLFNGNQNTVKLDGTEMTDIGDDGQTDYRRCDMLVHTTGEHTITCNTYEGNQWPCVMLVEVQNVSGDYYEPQQIGVNIDGINYVLTEQTVGDVTTRTATVARQSTELSGDVTVPAKVSYAKTVLEGNNWVQQTAYDYDVTAIIPAGFEIDQLPGIHRTTDGAFQECAITSISLPTTITSIPGGTFNGCQQLKSVTLSEGIETIGGGAFAGCTALEDIYLPETVTDMSGWYIFGGCTSLKKVNTPRLVTSLGNGCFMNSGIETFLIPTTLTSLGEACFATDSLKEIKICHQSYEDGSISFPEGSFDNVSDLRLIVPEGTKASLYSQVYPWKDFGEIIEYTDQNDEHQYNAYRVSYQEETSAAARRSASATETETLGYTPSGIELTLPERIKKNLYTYLATWQDKPETMAANDVVVTVVLALIGDMDNNEQLDTQDVIGLIDKFLNGLDDETKKIADINGDGNVDTNDAIIVIDIYLNSNATE